jgi:signal transduction histidine kinase
VVLVAQPAFALSWPAAATLLTGVATLSLLWGVWPYRDEPGGRAFAALAVTMSTLCLVYGVALTVRAPTALRELLEALSWVATIWAGVAFIAFGLSYTGRQHLLRTPAFGAVLAAEGLSSVVFLTNPWGVVWDDFAVTTVFGAAGAAFTRDVWFLGQVVVSAAFVAITTLLLLDTLVSYGRLYRRQSLALAVTPFFPAVPFITYGIGLGPLTTLSLVPVSLLPHAALDLYALFGGDMFEFDPATRRLGERAALDNLGNGVLVVDDDGRLITLNAAAEETLGVRKRAVVGDPLASLLGAEVGPDDDRTVSLRTDGQRRRYSVTTAPIRDSTGERVGHSVTLQDVTSLVLRERLVTVLNRVLRHNLRNDMSVVRGNAELLAERVEDDRLADSADTIVSTADSLLALGERARDLSNTVDPEGVAADPVAVEPLVSDLVADCRDRFPGATLSVSLPAEFAVRGDPELLRALLGNLLENAIVHTDDPEVTVTGADGPDETCTITVADDGPGIPDHEVAVLEDGEETALEHGSGLGLWVVQAATAALGGDVRFEADDEGTTVTVSLPAARR